MSGEPTWLIIARGELGEEEVPGNQDNPRILEYFKATTYHATHDEVPWCSAFVNWCMKQAGIKGSGSAAAVSWLHWGKGLDDPVPGCIVVFEWSNGGHHVAFYLDVLEGDYLSCLGGNQSNEVRVSNFPEDSVMAYRWPEGV